MESDDETRRLLTEIRDTHREHLTEYRRVAQQSLDWQQRAFERQQQIAAVYKRIVLLGGVLIIALVGLLMYLLVRWSAYLFR